MKTIQLSITEYNRTYDVIIGRNQLENDHIIKCSSKNDIWFHLDKYSGPHIVLKTNGDIIPKKYLNYIASLFRDYKNNLPNKYTVIFTEIKNLTMTDIPGQVIPNNCKKIKI